MLHPITPNKARLEASKAASRRFARILRLCGKWDHPNTETFRFRTDLQAHCEAAKMEDQGLSDRQVAAALNAVSTAILTP